MDWKNISPEKKIVMNKRHRIILWISGAVFVASCLSAAFMSSLFRNSIEVSDYAPLISIVVGLLSGLLALVAGTTLWNLKHPPKTAIERREEEKQKEEKIRGAQIQMMTVEERERESLPKYRLSPLKFRWMVVPWFICLAGTLGLLYFVIGKELAAIAITLAITLTSALGINTAASDDYEERRKIRISLFPNDDDPLYFSDLHVYTDSKLLMLLHRGGKAVAYISTAIAALIIAAIVLNWLADLTPMTIVILLLVIIIFILLKDKKIGL